MNELTFILILAGIGVVLLVAMFTYYKHHKKINDEIENFNHHANTIDDVLLNDNTISNSSSTGDKLTDSELPGSFTASRQDDFDIDQVNITHDNGYNIRPHIKKEINTDVSHADAGNRELVDGVYVNSKRVVSTSTDTIPQPSFKKTTETFASFVQQDNEQVKSPAPETDASNTVADTDSHHSAQDTAQKIKVVYEPVPEGVEELIISHTILTKGEFFSGQQLYNALENAGLSYGEMNIFHYPGDDKAETFALFSIANIIEPGTFDLSDGETMKTPGISLFMRLPTRMGSYKAYEKFIEIAQMIAADLGGELCDETRSQLTQQAISYKKEQIKKLNFEMTKAQKLADMRH